MSSFKFFCWVLERSLNSFPVEIANSETVGDLKEEIKGKMDIDGPASNLDLWKVSNLSQVQVMLLPTTNL